MGSRPTERVVHVLELLAAHPGGGLRFSELAREGGLSQATCHSILATLTEAGYVVRDRRTLTYTLGPALVALGNAASESFAEVRAGHEAFAALARRTGFAVSAAAVIDDAITVVDLVAIDGRELPITIGTRVPFAPPFGAIHVAWSSPEQIDAWIARAPRETLTAERLLAVVESHRATRLAVAPYTTTSADLRAALSELAVDALAHDVRERTLDLLAAIDELDYTADVLACADHLPVNTLTAPVFDDASRTAYAIALHVGAPDVAIEQIDALGAQLRAVAHDLTASIGGREPSDPDHDAQLVGAGTARDTRLAGVSPGGAS
jgi:DNA-binding IclR family transcriptional regulator